MALKFLANENFPKKSVEYLKEKGFDVLSIGIDNPSIKDHEVMDIAIEENRTILTFDSDYGSLIFKENCQPPKRVIYLRFNEFSPIEPGKFTEELVREEKIEFERTLTVYDSNGIRQRKY